MESRIKEQIGETPIKEVTELILDECKCTDGVKALSSEYESLEYLSMNNCDLKTLKGFPALPNLKRLELMDNGICGGLNALSGCTSLTHLNLSGNKIDDIATLEDLKSMTNLTHLELFNCHVASQNEFREKLFELLPHLQYLDGFDKNGAEAEDSGNEIDGDVCEDEDEDDDEDDEEEDDEVGLSYLNRDQVEEEDESVDYVPAADGVEDDEDEDEDDDEDDDGDYGAGDDDENSGAASGSKRSSSSGKSPAKSAAEQNGETDRGMKRKHDDTSNTGDGDSNSAAPPDKKESKPDENGESK